jgi:hypothetical protein
MPTTISMTFAGKGGESIAAAFARCGNPGPALDEFGSYKRDQIILSMPKLGPLMASAPGEPPGKHSGGFAQTMTYNVEGARLSVGSNDPRAQILQEGGTITATGKLLAIPLSEESDGKRPRDFPDLVLTFRRTFEGLTAFLVREHEAHTTMMNRNARERIGRTGKTFYVKTVHENPDFLFVLKHSVDIFEHPYLEWTPQDVVELLRAIEHNWNAA